jgi:putative ABC transport system permease protein
VKALIARFLPLAELAMAARNVFRQRARSILTLSIIGVGVAGLALSGGFVDASLDALRETTIHSQLGHLQVYKKGYYAEGKRSPFHYLIDKPGDVVAEIEEMPDVRRAMQRVAFGAILNNGKTDYAVNGEGVDVEREALLGTQIRIVAGRALEPKDRFGVLVGEGVASGLGLHPGDVVNLVVNTEEGALNNLEFTVTGVFHTFSKDYDARAVRVPLASAQELLASPAVNAVVVELQKTDRTEDAAAAVRTTFESRGFEVKTWLDLADFYAQTAALFKRQFAVLQAIIVLAVLLSVANSVNITIFERTGEFGTLMALGTKRRALFRLVLLENCIVGILGSFCGVVLALLAAGVINALHIQLPPPPSSNAGFYARIDLDAAIVGICFVLGFVATPLSAILPARRIAALPVVDALRAN